MEQRHNSSPCKPFEISITRSGGEVAVVPVGELDLASADRLAQEVGQLRTADSPGIVLDLPQVDFIDSAGLRILLSLRNDAKRNEHSLTLVPPPAACATDLRDHGTRVMFDWQSDHIAEP